MQPGGNYEVKKRSSLDRLRSARKETKVISSWKGFTDSAERALSSR